MHVPEIHSRRSTPEVSARILPPSLVSSPIKRGPTISEVRALVEHSGKGRKGRGFDEQVVRGDHAIRVGAARKPLVEPEVRPAGVPRIRIEAGQHDVVG